jgi:preprotein translocase subunit SecY
MWLGELITDRGVGNGMSILMFTSIAARIPNEGNTILQTAGGFVFTLIVLLGLAIIAAVVFVEQAQRRIPVQYAKRMVGRRMYGGTSTYIPVKINQSGVIPIIFASSLLYFPAMIVTVIPTSKPWSILKDFVNNHVVNQTSPVHIVFYGLLVIGFAYFYTAIAFNPVDVADNMKKYGGFIPGIRPGKATADHLQFILSRITLPGAIFIAAIAILPSIALATLQVKRLPFGGTSILITVGVALETMKQVESQLLMRHYEGFLS